ncbi:related to EMI1 Protein required for transcriptional induction of the early meiotic-specific transcription factor IME1, also required for sporulation [Phialocephala subalpina]|uniref:Related to EMI1 Protein required for transcriptional induction of the early meiotic-specific transcription factor IME1, also required for sporulation n=1 Tax=Phialocephala subalpina TaxID=576137 RepID=A0A1L7WW48_9HELO|nr:related to EMI1 Protein required for transcriptional induction of the early meiotic-specific transcription factor IME1, also required for sporulation [Phialocephala subalpina]
MGWLWSSTPNSAPATSSQAGTTLPPPQSTPEPTSAHPKPLSRDELAEQELQSFLKEINDDTNPKETKKFSRIPRSLPSNNSSSQSITTHDPSEALGDQLLPTTMSCRQAFDEAFYCNSFGGRFNDLYRYGNLRSCSEHWNNFWFCMRVRTYSGPEKEAAVKEHYRRRESIKYSKELGKESSEDVWKSRDKKLEWGEAFNQPFPEEYKGSDEEWRKMDLAARRAGRGEADGTMG